MYGSHSDKENVKIVQLENVMMRKKELDYLRFWFAGHQFGRLTVLCKMRVDADWSLLDLR